MKNPKTKHNDDTKEEQKKKNKTKQKKKQVFINTVKLFNFASDLISPILQVMKICD